MPPLAVRLALAAGAAGVLGGLYLATGDIGWALAFVVAPFAMVVVETWRLRHEGLASDPAGNAGDTTAERPRRDPVAPELPGPKGASEGSGTGRPTKRRGAKRVTRWGPLRIESGTKNVPEAEVPELSREADDLLLQLWGIEATAEQLSRELDKTLDAVLRSATPHRAEQGGASPDVVSSQPAEPATGATLSATGIRRELGRLPLAELLAEAFLWLEYEREGSEPSGWVRFIDQQLHGIALQVDVLSPKATEENSLRLLPLRERLTAFVLRERVRHQGSSAAGSAGSPSKGDDPV